MGTFFGFKKITTSECAVTRMFVNELPKFVGEGQV